MARAWGNAMVLHTLCHYACFCFKKMPISSATDTVFYPLQDNPANIRMQENVGSQGTISTKLPWWRRSSGSTTLLSAMLSQRRRLQRRRRPNHRVCRHLLRLIARFAACALGISSPLNQHSRGSHTARAVEDLAEREPPSSQVVCGPPTYRLRRHRPVRVLLARLVRGLHAAGPDLGDTHGLCLATPQHIQPFMNAVGAAREGPRLKRKSHKRCRLTAQAFLECVSLHCDGPCVFDIEALPSISNIHL
jgi:hypothetical protein